MSFLPPTSRAVGSVGDFASVASRFGVRGVDVRFDPATAVHKATTGLYRRGAKDNVRSIFGLDFNPKGAASMLHPSADGEEEEAPLLTKVSVPMERQEDWARIGQGEYCFFDRQCFDRDGRKMESRLTAWNWLNGYLSSTEGRIKYGNDRTAAKLVERFVPAGFQMTTHTDTDAAASGLHGLVAVGRGGVLYGPRNIAPVVRHTVGMLDILWFVWIRVTVPTSVHDVMQPAGNVPITYWQLVPWFSSSNHQLSPPTPLFLTPEWRGKCFRVGLVTKVPSFNTASWTDSVTFDAACSYLPLSTETKRSEPARNRLPELEITY